MVPINVGPTVRGRLRRGDGRGMPQASRRDTEGRQLGGPGEDAILLRRNPPRRSMSSCPGTRSPERAARPAEPPLPPDAGGSSRPWECNAARAVIPQPRASAGNPHPASAANRPRETRPACRRRLSRPIARRIDPPVRPKRDDRPRSPPGAASGVADRQARLRAGPTRRGHQGGATWRRPSSRPPGRSRAPGTPRAGPRLGSSFREGTRREAVPAVDVLPRAP